MVNKIILFIYFKLTCFSLKRRSLAPSQRGPQRPESRHSFTPPLLKKNKRACQQELEREQELDRKRQSALRDDDIVVIVFAAFRSPCIVVSPRPLSLCGALIM